MTARGEIISVFCSGMYRLKYDLSIRKDCSLGAEKIMLKSTKNAVPSGMLPAGSVIYVEKVKHLSYSVWGRYAHGWLCMYMNHTAYMEQVENELSGGISENPYESQYINEK